MAIVLTISKGGYRPRMSVHSYSSLRHHIREGFSPVSVSYIGGTPGGNKRIGGSKDGILVSRMSTDPGVEARDTHLVPLQRTLGRANGRIS